MHTLSPVLKFSPLHHGKLGFFLSLNPTILHSEAILDQTKTHGAPEIILRTQQKLKRPSLLLCYWASQSVTAYSCTIHWQVRYFFYQYSVLPSS